MQNCSQKIILSCSYPKCLLFHQLTKAINSVYKVRSYKVAKKYLQIRFHFFEGGGGGGTGLGGQVLCLDFIHR